MNQTITILDNTFVLHPAGGIYWVEQETLLIADVHLGKVSHFRKHGSAVPYKAVAENFIQLSRIADSFKPKGICFLGDLFHSSLNTEWNLFEDWVASREENIILVAGNHDIIAPLKYEKLGVPIYSEIKTGTFLLTHHPEETEGFFNFCGHIHPGIRLGGIGRQVLKLSCFFKTENQLILPAFGTFTGNYYLEPKPGDAVFAVTKKEVIQVQ
ncbi:ligase-associated DNA damage response endonuclease PdeM [Leeuwenhoekiella sp. W20_SRS_FM14]|uniref:ligase-associated DNA damage response endonuclease PdeM n=1 Tax=Leeuwenhoekiella sp. W20_SRS_FM14 TaxID=3240270 RepID=UPI003F9A1576